MSTTSARSRRCTPRVTLAAAAMAIAVVGAGAGSAWAHTESEYVAVPAGAEVTVHFAPTHGCSGSPTTGVSVRVPAPGATAGEVEGFTSAAEADGERTVLRWTGGLVPAEEEGSFPITFTVPDRVGELLLFPTVQTCEVGEIAWIDGDPAGENPAVRVLVLPAGSEAATSIDEVPADAPGRDLLTSIVDVDNPAGGGTTVAATTAPPATTTAAPTTTASTATTAVTGGSTSAVTETTAGENMSTTTGSPATTVDAEDEDDGSGAATIVFVVVVLVIVAGAVVGVLVTRRKR